LTLERGDKLVTLADARRVVLEHLGSEVEDEVEDLELSHAMRLLLAADLTRRSADRKAATDQVAPALKVRPVQ
jgi:hypothetical protein